MVLSWSRTWYPNDSACRITSALMKERSDPESIKASYDRCWNVTVMWGRGWYVMRGSVATASSPILAAFPENGGWQSLVSTPFLPHQEQNFLSGLLQSARVWPFCLHLQQHSFRQYAAATVDPGAFFLSVRSSRRCFSMASYWEARVLRSLKLVEGNVYSGCSETKRLMQERISAPLTCCPCRVSSTFLQAVPLWVDKASSSWDPWKTISPPSISFTKQVSVRAPRNVRSSRLFARDSSTEPGKETPTCKERK